MNSPLPEVLASAAATSLASQVPPPNGIPQQQPTPMSSGTREDGVPSRSEPVQDHSLSDVKTEPSYASLPPPNTTITTPTIADTTTSISPPATGPSSATPDPAHPPPDASSKSTTKPQRHCLTRDQRRDILLMRSLGHTYHQICRHLNVPFGAVQYTCQKRSASPKRRPGRARRLTDERLAEIEAFMTSSIANRQLTYQEVVKAMNLDVSEDTLTQAMRKRGLVRQMAFLKSPLAVGNTTAKPIRTYLTCRKDEEIDSPLVLEVIKRKGA